MLQDLSRELFPSSNETPKILIIDDKEYWRELLARYARLLKLQPIVASNLNQAKEFLERSRREGSPFILATIDLRFTIGEGDESTEIFEGTEILQYIKVEHPEVACLMISGETMSPSKLLDLRDYYGLDYYLEKDRIEPIEVKKAISRALERVRVIQNETESLSTSSYHVSPRKLREIIDHFFSEEELKDLCFIIDIEYEVLGGVGKSGKSRELITFAKRHGRYNELLKTCYDLRSHAF